MGHFFHLNVWRPSVFIHYWSLGWNGWAKWKFDYARGHPTNGLLKSLIFSSRVYRCSLTSRHNCKVFFFCILTLKTTQVSFLPCSVLAIGISRHQFKLSEDWAIWTQRWKGGQVWGILGFFRKLLEKGNMYDIFRTITIQRDNWKQVLFHEWETAPLWWNPWLMPMLMRSEKAD